MHITSFSALQRAHVIKRAFDVKNAFAPVWRRATASFASKAIYIISIISSQMLKNESFDEKFLFQAGYSRHRGQFCIILAKFHDIRFPRFCDAMYDRASLNAAEQTVYAKNPALGGHEALLKFDHQVKRLMVIPQGLKKA